MVVQSDSVSSALGSIPSRLWGLLVMDCGKSKPEDCIQLPPHVCFVFLPRSMVLDILFHFGEWSLYSVCVDVVLAWMMGVTADGWLSGSFGGHARLEMFTFNQ